MTWLFPGSLHSPLYHGAHALEFHGLTEAEYREQAECDA